MFQSARFKLTLWYLLIIMVISASFSIFVFKVSTNEIERFENLQRIRIERRYLNPFFSNLPPSQVPVISIDESLIHDTELRMVVYLIVLNVAIAVISGIAGYFLSGVTLLPIKEMVDEQNRFITDASHELRTPLTSLKLAMEVYLRSKKKTISESESLVTDSIIEVNKLQTLSTSLLELASFDKPGSKLNLSKFDVSDSIRQGIKKVQPMAIQKKINIKEELESIKIQADLEMITELVVILMDNAVKYSPKGSEVNVKSSKLDGQVRIDITDHGDGIDKKDLMHIFDRFYRADKSRTDNGYGLGLSIAKRIIDLHHGKIAVSSTMGKGSTFVVNLPVDQK